MSEDTARAVGTQGPKPVTIAGKDCYPRPLGISELLEVERYCLEQYREGYVKTFSNNAKYLPEKEQVGLVMGKIEEAARWDVSDLPSKKASDSEKIIINEKVRDWLDGNSLVPEGEDSDNIPAKLCQQLMATASDEGMISDGDFKDLTGDIPHKENVPYVQWWITGCYGGMIEMVSVCFRGDGVTREDVIDALGKDKGLLAALSRQIELLSTPAVGNG